MMDSIAEVTRTFGADMAKAGRERGYARAISDAITIVADHKEIHPAVRLALFAELSALNWPGLERESIQGREAA